jgi:hypothetical protein
MEVIAVSEQAILYAQASLASVRRTSRTKPDAPTNWLAVLPTTSMDDAIALDDWHTLLDAHPIFHVPARSGKSLTERPVQESEHGYVLSGRRQLMALKDADLIVAAGSELRMTSLWDTKLGRETGKSYKVRPGAHAVGPDMERSMPGSPRTKRRLPNTPTRTEP